MKFKRVLKEYTDFTPTNIDPGSKNNLMQKALSPAMAKRQFLYGKSGARKGTIRSTSQSRRETLENITAQNVMPTLESAYEYMIAIGTAFKPALGSRLRSEVRRIQRIVKQFVDREARKQT